MKQYLFLFTLLASCLVSLQSNGQLFTQGSVLTTVEQRAIAPIAYAPVPDSARIKALQQQNSKAKILRFGVVQPLALDFMQAMSWQVSANGTPLGIIRIKSQGAKHLSLLFDQFHLPVNAGLVLYSADGQHVVGKIGHDNNSRAAQLATVPVWGDDVYVEYQGPKEGAQLHLKQVVYAFKPIIIPPKAGQAYGDAGPCHINVACPQAASWGDQVRAVGHVVLGGSVCSGALINNTENDGTPYFLTADHCYENSVPAATWLFVFNWQSPLCSNQFVPYTFVINGAILKARNRGSDMCLLELSRRIPFTFNSFFAGWNRNNAATAGGAGVHHPEGDIKKISFYSSTPVSTIDDGSENWTVSWNPNNATEVGSSGSPLFNSQKEIIGQLFGGGSNCANSQTDYYGKLAVSWNGANGRLSTWLSPTNSNPQKMAGTDANCVAFLPKLPLQVQNLGLDVSSGFVKQSSPNVTNQLGIQALNPGQWFIETAKGAQARQSAQLVLPQVNLSLSINVSLSFKYAAGAKQLGQSDLLSIKLSTDCGKTFTTLDTLAGDSLIGYSGQTNTDFRPAQALYRKRNLTLINGLTRAMLAIEVLARGNGAGVFIDSVILIGTPAIAAPIPAFNVDRRVVCVGETVTFNDASALNPTSYNWTTTPNANIANGVGPRFRTSYNSPGLKSVTLTVRNANGQATLTKPEFIQVESITSRPFPYKEDFENYNIGLPNTWRLNENGFGDSTWRLRVPNRAPASSIVSRAMSLDNFTSANTGNEDYLFSPLVRIPAGQVPRLRFDVAYSFLSPSGDSLAAGISTDCGNGLNRLWQRGGQNLATTNAGAGYFIPAAATQYRQVNVVIDTLNLPVGLRAGFLNIGDYGQPIYIDNVAIDTVGCDNPPATNTTIVSCPQNPASITVPSIAGLASVNWWGDNGFRATGNTLSISQLPVKRRQTVSAYLSNGWCTSRPIVYTIISQGYIPTIVAQAGLVQLVLDSMPNEQLQVQWLLNGNPAGPSVNWNPSAGPLTLVSPQAGVISAQVSFSSGCTVSTPSLSFTPTRATELHYLGQLSLRPNPATTSFAINGIDADLPVSITIHNGLGQLFSKSTQQSGAHVDISAWPAGVYAVTIQYGQAQRVLRFIKE